MRKTLSIDLPDAQWRSRFTRQVLAWFERHARSLPWRTNRDPYRVWLSEVMLQQTQVATVVPYFERFLEAVPTVADLAAADEDHVLRLWEGLGYYRRARQLYRAAQIIVSEHAGQFPRDFEAARRLPGVGRYTAGAVLSIAFDLRLPVLEGNTERLYSRLVAFRGDSGNGDAHRQLWTLAEALVPRRRAGDFNQAVMELGALVCTVRSPGCSRCPVARLCASRAKGLESSIPVPRRRPPFEKVTEALVVVRRRGRVLILRHAKAGRWGGMWDFVRFPLRKALRRPASQLRYAVRDRTGLALASLRQVATLKHTVTRFQITLECWQAEAESGRVCATTAAEAKWVRAEELSSFALSTTARRLAALVRR